MESLEILNDNENLKFEKLNYLTKREGERQHNLQKKKDESNLRLANNEKLEVFESLFTEKEMYISNLVNNSQNIPKDKLPDHFNVISNEIVSLQKYVASCNIFLRHYDLQRCQGILQKLLSQSKLLEDELIPKKKFGFKNKPKQKIVNRHANDNTRDEVDFLPKYEESTCGFLNKKDETLLLTNADMFMKDVSVTKLENCKVYLKGSPSTLHLNNLKNCEVFSGPVSTSIFAENCESCTFVIACQQLRLHASKNINIYLHVTSRAIMEDCVNINVAPYNWKYNGIENDFQSAKLDITINNWKCIDDFNWLNEKHSPNWKEIEWKDQIRNWNEY